MPPHLSDKEVIARIDPAKDVDAFHPENVGAIMIGDYRFLPCTPAGVMELIRSTGTDLTGKRAVVLGRSNIVGPFQDTEFGRADQAGGCVGGGSGSP